LGNSAVREKRSKQNICIFCNKDPLLVANPLILCLVLKDRWELTPTIKTLPLLHLMI
jgi:hypothetical protein